VLDAAKAQGLRSGENPARWRGHLDQLLPKRQRLTRGHHAAMNYSDVPAFIADLQSRQATAAQALEFAILTAARSAEVLGARWEEFDLDRAVWTLPALRMKAGREHRVPLSGRALKIVKALDDNRSGDFVFAGQKPGTPLSVMALEMVLRRMKIENATVHGFRSTFRDWAAESTNFSNEVSARAWCSPRRGSWPLSSRSSRNLPRGLCRIMRAGSPRAPPQRQGGVGGTRGRTAPQRPIGKQMPNDRHRSRRRDKIQLYCLPTRTLSGFEPSGAKVKRCRRRQHSPVILGLYRRVLCYRGGNR
jgi:hypothetical protein